MHLKLGIIALLLAGLYLIAFFLMIALIIKLRGPSVSVDRMAALVMIFLFLTIIGKSPRLANAGREYAPLLTRVCAGWRVPADLALPCSAVVLLRDCAQRRVRQRVRGGSGDRNTHGQPTRRPPRLRGCHEHLRMVCLIALDRPAG